MLNLIPISFWRLSFLSFSYKMNHLSNTSLTNPIIDTKSLAGRTRSKIRIYNLLNKQDKIILGKN